MDDSKEVGYSQHNRKSKSESFQEPKNVFPPPIKKAWRTEWVETVVMCVINRKLNRPGGFREKKRIYMKKIKNKKPPLP